MITIICETPQDVFKLVEGGVSIKNVNIGNMHMSDSKRQVATSVAVDDNNTATFRKLQEYNPIEGLYVVGDVAVSWGGINDRTESVLLIVNLYGEE